MLFANLRGLGVGLGCWALAEFLGKKAQNRRHLRQRHSRLRKVAVSPGQFVPTLHYFVVDREQAVLNGIAAGGLMEKIGKDTVVILQSFVDTVERGRLWRSLQGILDLRKAQANGGRNFQSVLRSALLCQDQQARMSEPINKEDRTDDNDEDAGEHSPNRYKVNVRITILLRSHNRTFCLSSTNV